jgi:hypothetical protein
LLSSFEILFFSNTGNIDNIEFSFNGKSIPLSTSHKHLGVMLSQNAKWNEHLENMITNITKHLGILRKLKFSLNRSNLEKMYLVHKRKFDVDYVTGIGKKQDFFFFGIE